MKHKKTYILLFALSICLLIGYIGCKKYPEDPSISLLTMRTRMSGEWQFEKIEVNGEDIRYKYNDSLAPLTIDDFWFWFQFNITDYGSGKQNFMFINKQSKNEHDATNTDVCGIAFGVHPKKNKQIGIAQAPWKYIPHNDKIRSKILINILWRFQDWDIKRLYKKKMILESKINGIVYRLYFKQTRS